MKRTLLLGNRAVWLTAMAVVACAITAGAADTHQGYAKVRYVVGHAVVSKGGGAWQAVERFMILHPGDIVKTDAKSHVDLMLGYNNGSVQVTPSSELALDKLIYTTTGLEVIHDTQLNLRSGVLVGHVNKMTTGSKYEIKTPRGVAGVRGTTYRVAANGDITVTEGTLVQSLVMADGTIKTFTITAGYTLVAATGELRPATPEEIKWANDVAGDALTHGSDFVDLEFYRAAEVEPFISPTAPQ